MQTLNSPRTLLDSDAPNRFAVDKALVSRVHAFLSSHSKPESVHLLPATEQQLRECPDRTSTVAAVMLASGQFDLEGFSVSRRGVQWSLHPRTHVLARPYAYLSHLLRMNGDTVRLLFGPASPNDVLMHQWDSFPASGHQLLLARLSRYLREGDAVCHL